MLAKAPGVHGVTGMAAELSFAKSTTHGILAALEQAGWVIRDPVSRKYSIGHAFKDVASSARVDLPIVDRARPFLEKLAALIDEDVFLGILTPYHIMILDQVDSTKELKVATHPGTRLSIFAGAAGKIFLAFDDRGRASKLVRSARLPAFTPRSITDPDLYLEELDRVRRSGFATDVEEYIPDVRAVAVPVFLGSGRRRRLVAGIWVVGLSSSMSAEKMEKAAREAVKTGEAISSAIAENGY